MLLCGLLVSSAQADRQVARCFDELARDHRGELARGHRSCATARGTGGGGPPRGRGGLRLVCSGLCFFGASMASCLGSLRDSSAPL